MKHKRISKSRFALKGILCSALLVLAGSCSSPVPKGCAAPPHAIAVMTNSALSPILTASIRQSRNAALKDGARPVPDEIRAALEPFFDAATLDAVRWNVASRRWGLDTLIASTMPRYRAMTFGDTIIFREETGAGELDLWIHELLHVEQFRRAGGTAGFARAYLASWAQIEERTVRQTNRILGKMRASARQKLPTLGQSCPESPGKTTA
jgi:hypothetical protein